MPRPDDTGVRYVVGRPAAGTLVKVVLKESDATPVEVAMQVLEQFIPADEAQRLGQPFADALVPIIEDESFPSWFIIAADRVTDWLEAWWLAEFDSARGLGRPERWALGSLRSR